MLAAILAVAEVFTRGFFVAPFALGAAVAAALEFVRPGSVDAQWGAFIGVSSVVLIVVRRVILARERSRQATTSSSPTGPR
jgi:membrane protein implicated in regulation of membrane protease activity